MKFYILMTLFKMLKLQLLQLDNFYLKIVLNTGKIETKRGSLLILKGYFSYMIKCRMLVGCLKLQVKWRTCIKRIFDIMTDEICEVLGI